MSEDPIVSEVRKVREQLAGEFNFDVHAIFKDLRKRQLLAGHRLVRRQRVKKAEHAAAPAQDSATPHPGR